MSVLVEHIAALRKQFIAEHGKAPTVLALGRWDARELARVYAALSGGVAGSLALRACREGVEVWGAQVKVDGRLGRCPGSLWWQP